MPLFDTVTLSAAYFPPVEYFFAIAQSGRVVVEQNELYQKQSYRTRCSILTSSGVETLNVPVVHSSSRLIRDISVDYSEAWPQRMEKALKAAYMSSPFYIYYADDIIPLLHSGMNSLFELNLALINVLKELLGLRLNIFVTQKFVTDYGDGFLDLRNSIHPKKEMPQWLLLKRPYYQVFSSKVGYTPSLSILDLLFNEGPNAISYLR